MKIRTVFRPWEDLEVDDGEYASLLAMGLIAGQPPADPEIAAETADTGTAEPLPAKPRRTTKTTDSPAEEVNTDGSKQEGQQEG